MLGRGRLFSLHLFREYTREQGEKLATQGGEEGNSDVLARQRLEGRIT